MTNGNEAELRKQSDSESYGITLKGKHKSIESLEWENIPSLVILTGINGSGKSQLLEAIAKGSIVSTEQVSQSRLDIMVQFHDVALSHRDIRLITDPGAFSRPAPTSITALRHKIVELVDDDVSGDTESIRFRELLYALTDYHPNSGNARVSERVFDRLMENRGLLFRAPSLVEGVSDLFMSYRIAAYEAFERGTAREDLHEVVGIPPWTVLNDVLDAANFGYRVRVPTVGFTSEYRMELVAVDRDLAIDPADLSSGERVILATVLWLFGSEYNHALPKLLLLDEPDAHLHPSMTQQFLDVVDRVLVRRYGIRVILTTHSPSTVALAPEGSVFEMRRTEPRIVQSNSRWSTVGILTNGLITIGPDTKYVFTEDEDDVKFLRASQQALQRMRPLTDEPPPLAASPSLVFIPASQGRESGGRTMVASWVNQIEGTHTHGIIDRDAGNASGDRLHLLGRYEAENYLADPVVLFAYLHGRHEVPTALTINLPFGDEAKLRDLPTPDLQRIVDTVLDRLKPQLVANGSLASTQDDSLLDVTIVDGPTLKYPRWFLENKGKRFLQVIREVFGKQITFDELRLAYERIGWVPIDLLDTLQTVQRS